MSSTAAPPTRIYVDGVFDLFHAGHIAFLRKARSALVPAGLKVVGEALAPVVLIVGVITDEDAGWKRRPYVSHADRVTVVRHCKLVDFVVERPPLVITDQFLADHAIDLVVHGDDSAQADFFAVPIALPRGA